MTEIEMSPPSSAARPISASVEPMAGAPPGHPKFVLCTPTFMIDPSQERHSPEGLPVVAGELLEREWGHTGEPLVFLGDPSGPGPAHGPADAGCPADHEANPAIHGG